MFDDSHLKLTALSLSAPVFLLTNGSTAGWAVINIIYTWCLGLGTSVVAQTVKRLPTIRETRVPSLVQEDLLEKETFPLQYSCLKHPMDEGACSATVHGVTESWTRLSDFTFTFIHDFTAFKTFHINLIWNKGFFWGLGSIHNKSFLPKWVYYGITQNPDRKPFTLISKKNIYIYMWKNMEQRGIPRRSSGKESTCQCRWCKRHTFHPRGGDPLEVEMATHSSLLVWKIP